MNSRAWTCSKQNDHQYRGNGYEGNSRYSPEDHLGRRREFIIPKTEMNSAVKDAKEEKQAECYSGRRVGRVSMVLEIPDTGPCFYIEIRRTKGEIIRTVVFRAYVNVECCQHFVISQTRLQQDSTVIHLLGKVTWRVCRMIFCGHARYESKAVFCVNWHQRERCSLLAL